MIRYKAGYKYVATGVHAQVLDFPAAITCAADLDAARRLLAVALVDVAEAAVEAGEPLPLPRPSATRRWTSRSRSTCIWWPAPRSERSRPGLSHEARGPAAAPAVARLPA